MRNKDNYIKFIYHMKKLGIIENSEYIRALKKVESNIKNLTLKKIVIDNLKWKEKEKENLKLNILILKMRMN